MELKLAGCPHARVDDRRPSLPTLKIWVEMVVLLVLVLVGNAERGWAQEEGEPEYAVQARLAAQSLLLDAAAVEGKLVAVGQRGHILISSDGGTTWEQAKVPTRANLTGVYFRDGEHGWVVGHDSVILRTTDGGVSWELLFSAPEDEAPFFDVWFSDAENGVAIGAYGSYFVTADSGDTWSFEPISDEDDFHLHQIARSESGRLYIAAEAGVIYSSDDDGTTWNELMAPYGGSFFGVLPVRGDEVLIFGLRGHLFRSEDAGESWVAVETGTVATLTDGILLPDGRVVITGLGGTLLVSKDGGRNFDLHQQSSRRGIQTAVMASQDSLLLVGEFGVRMMPLNELETEGGLAP